MRNSFRQSALVERGASRGSGAGLKAFLLAVLCGAWLGSSGRGSAQLALDHYQPAPVATDGFAVSRPRGLGHMQLAAQLTLDYGYKPLVLREPNGRETSLVGHQLVGNAAVAFGLFDALTVFAGVPVQLVQKGDVGTTDSLGTVGDAWLGGRFHFLGHDRQPFALGAEAIAHLPTAQWSDPKQLYSGDEVGSYDVALLSEAKVWRISAGFRPGLRVRKAQRIDARLDMGSELLLSGYLRVRVLDWLDASAEVYGDSSFNAFYYPRATPFETLFGVKATKWDFVFGAAAGPGITRGYGSPEVRGLISVAYLHSLRRKAREPAPVVDDADHDGVRGAADKCPREAEDKDEFEDADGCPDADNDADGVLDAQDKCPEEAEDKDGFADEDGCPDEDNDGDEIPDAKDKCPLETEDRDGFADEDGCLDRDNDFDGVIDPNDHCRDEAGPASNHGCPAPNAPPLAVIDKGEIRITQRIEFQVNKDKLLPESTPVLEAVQQVLAANPEVKRLRVEGHTDSTGSEGKNLELSRKRAEAVVAWLVTHEIARDRLIAVGCGPRRPLEPNITNEGKRKNRRVEFHLLDPAPTEPVDASMCKGK